jgi:hypothetical protein
MFLPEDDSNDRPAPQQEYCPECGDEVDQPGLCIFCFATASIEGQGEDNEPD